ncbi:dihydrofolate reductase family protein [Dactylosporangium matsuzakiense]|uniref:Deaminase n=1 Tax=Dactylosporangium matsuzakiense TaxID=53360 RepID=A0A9W6NIA7_9ACTN|nr:dihydrofolate reductase family protein [Dactylosporangium matsuzakiense]UWZ45348.1 dihydrofolate reductase family protein [Dactylosporangium matsuzakiense]GLK98674.1 deaminase [Dactylosporangium matsuzakiense]
MRKLVYYVAATIDGFIAGPGGEVDFFPFEADLQEFIRARYPETLPTHVRPHAGIPDGTPNLVFDTLVMGRATLDPALRAGISRPYAHLRQYTFSRRLDSGPEIIDGDPVAFVRELKREDGLDIWLCGGGDLAGQLLGEVDELVIKLSPVIAGQGVPLVRHGFEPTRFRLVSATPLESGVVVLTYARATGA